MKIKKRFDLSKCPSNCNPNCFIKLPDGTFKEVELLKKDANGKYPIICYVDNSDRSMGDTENSYILIKFNKDGISSNYYDLGGDELMDYLVLYVEVEAQNFWVNIYMNYITGNVTSGKGHYDSKEDAESNINIPINCNYLQTIYCEL